MAHPGIWRSGYEPFAGAKSSTDQVSIRIHKHKEPAAAGFVSVRRRNLLLVRSFRFLANFVESLIDRCLSVNLAGVELHFVQSFLRFFKSSRVAGQKRFSELLHCLPLQGVAKLVVHELVPSLQFFRSFAILLLIAIARLGFSITGGSGAIRL